MSNDIDPKQARILIEKRLAPYLKMDIDTGEVVACLDEPTFEQLRQIVGEEVRKALHEDESDWQAQIVTFPTPANALSVEWSIGGKRYKGILFEQHEEESQ